MRKKVQGPWVVGRLMSDRFCDMELTGYDIVYLFLFVKIRCTVHLWLSFEIAFHVKMLCCIV